MSDEPAGQEKSPSLGKVVGSVLASFFGVQGARQHEQDFTKGRPLPYILVGLGATILFVLTIYLVVKLVVGAATG